MSRNAWKLIPQKELVTIETKESCWYYFHLKEHDAVRCQIYEADVRRIGSMGAEWFGCEGSIVRCIKPQPGVVYLFRFRHISTDEIFAWDAFIFNGKEWFRPDQWYMPIEVGQRSMRFYLSTSSHLETSDDGVSEEHMLRLWARQASLADLLLIDWVTKTQPKLCEALGEAEKLHGAVRSKSAARIKKLLQEVVSRIPDVSSDNSPVPLKGPERVSL